jgi:IS5 family transposase
MQNWFGYSDPAMEESLYETTILRHFAGLSLERIPDETTHHSQLPPPTGETRPGRRDSGRH